MDSNCSLKKGKMGKFSLKSKKYKISEENAIEQIMPLLERYDVDVDELSDEIEEGETQSKKEAMVSSIEKVVKCIRLGHLEVFEENGEVKVKLIIQNTTEKSTVSELVFGELRGKDHIAMPKKGNEFEKMFGLLGSMCETNGGPAALRQLRSSDATAAEYLSLLFL
jgi:hypothetical protein